MFEVYCSMDQRMPLTRIPEHARRAEALGYDGLHVPEAVHDSMLGALTALGATRGLRVATSVLVAFPRSPMTVAVAAWDLQAYSGGRFELGLGTQVRGNIVDRYSTPWTAPVPRMREYVESLRAIWKAWRTGGELRFEGEHYRFTRMQPFFRPDVIDAPDVPIFLGAVGPAMTALAGEVADGMATHPTNSSPRYLLDVIRPRLQKGAARRGRDASEIRLAIECLIATGPSGDHVQQERDRCRQLLAFLYSTPAYWPSLELYGWRDVGERLRELTRAGRWDDLTSAISDEMLDTLVVSGTSDEIARAITDRFDGLVTRVALPLPSDPAHDAAHSRVIEQLRTG